MGKKILEQIKCYNCQNSLRSAPTDLQNVFINFKEWSDKEHKLFSPSEDLIVFVGAAVTILENFISNHGGRTGLRKAAIQEILNNLDCSWLNCDQHKDIVAESIANAVCAIGIPWWCKRKNNELTEMKKDIRSTRSKLKKSIYTI